MKGVQKKNLTGAKCENNISSVNEETIIVVNAIIVVNDGRSIPWTFSQLSGFFSSFFHKYLS